MYYFFAHKKISSFSVFHRQHRHRLRRRGPQTWHRRLEGQDEPPSLRSQKRAAPLLASDRRRHDTFRGQQVPDPDGDQRQG